MKRVSIRDLSPAERDLLERRYDGRIPQREIEHAYRQEIYRLQQQEQQRKEAS